ncbi:uncharacterized protein LOC113147301 [Cyclospora cayetanensis]|uniref:Uncharacterized protein LOC113147301 n=1 Tax=Cyclospora cayetanensis TaxID=88456 RepID=A0A6P6S0P5_9EIME|nr:uncharacterized protein LOC113147301 [Cyclospora cayetanensis]
MDARGGACAFARGCRETMHKKEEKTLAESGDIDLKESGKSNVTGSPASRGIQNHCMQPQETNTHGWKKSNSLDRCTAVWGHGIFLRVFGLKRIPFPLFVHFTPCAVLGGLLAAWPLTVEPGIINGQKHGVSCHFGRCLLLLEPSEQPTAYCISAQVHFSAARYYGFLALEKPTVCLETLAANACKPSSCCTENRFSGSPAAPACGAYWSLSFGKHTRKNARASRLDSGPPQAQANCTDNLPSLPSAILEEYPRSPHSKVGSAKQRPVRRSNSEEVADAVINATEADILRLLELRDPAEAAPTTAANTPTQADCKQQPAARAQGFARYEMAYQEKATCAEALRRHDSLPMSSESHWLCAGRVRGAHGLLGQLKIHPTTFAAEERFCTPCKVVFASLSPFRAVCRHSLCLRIVLEISFRVPLLLDAPFSVSVVGLAFR